MCKDSIYFFSKNIPVNFFLQLQKKSIFAINYQVWHSVVNK